MKFIQKFTIGERNQNTQIFQQFKSSQINTRELARTSETGNS